MKNLLSYIKTNNDSFDISPINNADALVFSWISYFMYPDECKSSSMTIKDLCVFQKDKHFFEKAFNQSASKKMLKLLVKSPRFQNAKISDYCEISSASEEKQFGGIRIEFAPHSYFISYRGTDPSFVGWKEDFNLAYLNTIPSQEEARSYFQDMVGKDSSGKYYLGGHSKGGNLAVFVSIKCEAEISAKIEKAYSFDGPGFCTDIFQDENYQLVKDKIFKFIPQASFVGVLFKYHQDYSIVRSNGFLFLQHDPFTWKIPTNDFIYLKKMFSPSRMLKKRVNDYIYSTSNEDRERLIRIIFEALFSLKIDNFNVFFRTLFIQVPALVRCYFRLEKSDKSFFKFMIKKLFLASKVKENRKSNI